MTTLIGYKRKLDFFLTYNMVAGRKTILMPWYHFSLVTIYNLTTHCLLLSKCVISHLKDSSSSFRKSISPKRTAYHTPYTTILTSTTICNRTQFVQKSRRIFVVWADNQNAHSLFFPPCTEGLKGNSSQSTFSSWCIYRMLKKMTQPTI